MSSTAGIGSARARSTPLMPESLSMFNPSESFVPVELVDSDSVSKGAMPSVAPASRNQVRPPVSPAPAHEKRTSAKTNGLLIGSLIAGGVATCFLGLCLVVTVFLAGVSSTAPAPTSSDPFSSPTATWDGQNWNGQSWTGSSNDGYFTGESRIGGLPMNSGTFDSSGGGNHVISVDGEVLNLPPY